MEIFPVRILTHIDGDFAPDNVDLRKIGRFDLDFHTVCFLHFGDDVGKRVSNEIQNTLCP